MQIGELKTKINEMINEQLRANGSVALAWVVNALVLECNLPDEDHEEQSMQLILLREGCRQIVGAVNRERKGQEVESDVDEQLVLPGFQRLQSAYSIKRKKKDWIVQIEQLSLDEVLAKRSQLVVMMKGIGKHVKELDRYIHQRWPDAA